MPYLMLHNLSKLRGVVDTDMVRFGAGKFDVELSEIHKDKKFSF